MTGLCGIVGPSDCSLSPLLSDHTNESDVANAFRDDRVAVGVATLTDEGEPPASSSRGESLVWVWGDVHGVSGESGYESKYDAADVPATVDYCRTLVDRYGPSFVARANGTFAAVVYDRDADRVHVSTDRLGTHPVYLAETGDGALVFGTSLQALAVRPGVDARFDPDALGVYFATGSVPGTRTVFENVDELGPATTLTVDLRTGETTRDRYWTPRHRPVDSPFDAVADDFARTVRAVVADRLGDGPGRAEERVGLLLSGGSDSRLVLAATDRPVSTYHMNDWMNREARTAERAAQVAGRPFELLTRDEGYPARVLDANASFANFAGEFSQGHATGFRDELRADVDLLVTGLFSDWLFKGLSLRRRTIPLGPLGTFQLPWEDAPADLSAFVARRARPLPAYVRGAAPVASTLAAGASDTPSGVDYHGVAYPSLRELVSYGECDPMSNDADLFYAGLTQTVPHWTPFLDNRLVDFALTVPVAYQLGPNLVAAAVSRLDPELAAIPHASSGVPLSRPYPLDFAEVKLRALDRTLLRPERGTRPYHVGGPWTDHAAYIRESSFVLDALLADREVVAAFPFLDWDGVLRTYREHLAGADHSLALYTLLTFLRMPAVRELAARRARPGETPEATAGATIAVESVASTDGGPR